MHTVINLLKSASIKYYNKNYISEKVEKTWISKTFSEVDLESDYFAISLINKGFVKDDKIAILAEGRINWIVGEFGILKNRCISVPLSIKLLPEEILFRLIHSDSKAIITSKNNIEKVLKISDKFIKNFKIFYIDKLDKELVTLIEKYKFNKDNFFIFDDLINYGKQNFESQKTNLEKIKSEINENDIVNISYTSGTTGNPKGIMLSHLNYYSNSLDADLHFELPEFYKTLLILPLDHSFAHTVGIYISLLKGINISFVDSRGGGLNTLKNIPINLKEINPDFLLTVPALTGNFMNKIKAGIKEKGNIINKIFNLGIKSAIKINKNGYNKSKNIFSNLINYFPYLLAKKLIFKKVKTIFGSNIKFFVGGGALLDINQQNFYYSIGVPVFQGYGLTESSPIISANTIKNHKLGSSGKIIPNIECFIFDDNNKPLGKGKKGQIVIKGNNVMHGYYKNPKATNEVLKNDMLFTGDLGYIDNDNFLYVVGREKALLISDDGEKYSPDEIEETIVNTSEIIQQLMLYNDHKNKTTCLITLNNTNIKNIISDKKVKTPEQLLDIIANDLFKIKKSENTFPTKWLPSTFAIIPEPFSEENKMINSTMKMVRYKITKTYMDTINYMYSKEGKNYKNKKNIDALKNIYFSI